MAEQSRVYGNFRGVDFTSDPSQVSPYRFSHCVNMWKDYESQNGIAVETFPGYRRLAHAFGNMNGIHKFGDKIYCHIGTKLYLLSGGQFEEKASGLADSKSTSFVWGGKLYILDGTDYWRFNGKLEKVKDVSYIPTVSVNGEEYEAVNVISDKKREQVFARSFESTYSPNLIFGTATFQSGVVTAYSLKGITSDYERVIKIPHEVNGNTVEGISLSVSTMNLVDLIIPSTIKYIAAGSFLSQNIPVNRVWYEGTAEQWESIKLENFDAVAELEAQNPSFYFGKNPDADVLYFAGDLSETAYASIGNRYNASFYYLGNNNGYLPMGSYIFVGSGLENVKKISESRTVANENVDAAFFKCTIVQSFNGNLFFSGSPDAPSKIWWCAAPKDTGIPDPAYIGEYNYDLCGLDTSPIVSMMAQSSVLTVFKEKSEQDATIYYYSALESSDDLAPSIYAESEGGSGIACVGASCNFLDDAVFLSKRGLEGIQKEAVNLERSVVHRSSFVDAKLKAEDLPKAWLLEWKGYLCVLFPNGHMYLADSRRTASGNEGTEYEWFYVEGLQGYANDFVNLHLYADAADLYQLSLSGVVDIDGNELKANESASIDDIVSGKVMSTTIDGKTVYYEAKTYYLCKRSDELSPATTQKPILCAAVINDVLYFGAGDSMYCINTDKREGDTIPNKWYTFCGRRYKSGFVTFADNCGVPHLRKKIIKKSLVVKTKSMDNSKFYLKVGTDRVPFNENEEVHTSGTLDFGALKFDTMDLFDQDKTIVPFRASAKKFVEAQLMLYSDGFKRPFGVYNMAFRFEVTGRVKE